jgi:hypothetical protein
VTITSHIAQYAAEYFVLGPLLMCALLQFFKMWKNGEGLGPGPVGDELKYEDDPDHIDDLDWSDEIHANTYNPGDPTSFHGREYSLRLDEEQRERMKSFKKTNQRPISIILGSVR